MQPISRRIILKSASLGALASCATGAYADFGSRWIEVVHKEILLPNWDADGFKVAFFADVHVNDPQATSLAAQACAIAVEAKPDLVVFGGDFVNSSGRVILTNFGPAFEPLSGLDCPCVAVMGNHDYATLRPAEVMDAIAKLTCLRLLRNEFLDVHGVTVAGIDDGIYGSSNYRFMHRSKMSKSTLVAFHEPDFVERLDAPASLMLSGHSHGGQICLPFGIPVHTPYGARKYISGYFPDAKIPLYVSRGVGVTGPLFRLFCRPEVTILTLRSA